MMLFQKWRELLGGHSHLDLPRLVTGSTIDNKTIKGVVTQSGLKIKSKQ